MGPVIVKLILFTALWLVLSGGDPGSWVLGLPTVAAAVWLSHRLGTVSIDRPSISGVVRFIPFFLWESFRGGVDVLVRVMRPQMRIAPGFRSYKMRLRNSSAQLLFLNSVSLLPGTLAADIDSGSLVIHALDANSDFTRELQRLEQAVARVFAEEVNLDA